MKPILQDDIERLRKIAVTALEDLKAQDIRIVDLRGKSPLMDLMIIATGTSDRHVKSLAGNVARCAKQAGFDVRGSEGEREGEWVLVDLDDIVVHVMLPRVRDFYNLEKLWTAEAEPEAEPSHGQG
ncbi:ribosome silencing factor [Acidihalobacter prosperus]|uniref:Ribosomal silencing factor RsfS n=1 Tax=Acidihalobacter prosperus TaxID=160660 RepID=A0A1A6C5X8_9GAMM|nr:ribosome silencing factor [Acidihalobacter prosperus]OBS09962.1 ribosome silencing factor RsfS [Acidihalobacter prosperus]